MIALPKVRDAIVYVISRELSYKGNKCTGLDIVLWDANVYVILRELSCKGNECTKLDLVVPNSRNVDVLVQLRHTCMLEITHIHVLLSNRSKIIL
jgi:hypothetical protein